MVSAEKNEKTIEEKEKKPNKKLFKNRDASPFHEFFLI